MLRRFSAFILRVFGWKIEGRYPHELPRVVLIVIPHTSNWDFPLGLLVRSAQGIDIWFVAKDSIFRPPFGWLFRMLGGYPVNRKKSTNFVRSMMDIFEREKRFHVVLAPEGTRSKVDKLKTGFYYIARNSAAAIVMCRFDWEHKVVAFSEPFSPSADKDADFKIIDDYYRGTKGKCPELGYLYQG
jgi:1-acyl-sn-glycerol-3-phosphate acyltransferase